MTSRPLSQPDVGRGCCADLSPKDLFGVLNHTCTTAQAAREPDTRSVAEIIGWVRWSLTDGSGGYWLPPGVSPGDAFGMEPSIDDMLVWLDQNCPVSWDFGGRPGAYWVHTIEVTEGHGNIRDALESAIRSVADA